MVLYRQPWSILRRHMFLAINELLKEKTRFFLIIAVIALVSYLTFFLTALAYGLATGYTQGIGKWNASGIVLLKDSNDNIARSLLFKSDYDKLPKESTALLGSGSATVLDDDKDDVAIFGVGMDDFLAPNITEGREVTSDKEVVVSDELKQIGVALNDTLALQGAEAQFTVVGFTDKATFQTAPIVYMELDSWRLVASELAGMTGMADSSTVSAVVTKGDSDTSVFNDDRMQWQAIKDFSFKLPGYNAQVLTFSTMIGFLIVIASFVLAIFMYILTLQKKSMFGVLKAEGVSNGYIVRSVNIQILVLSVLGMSIGLALTLLSGFALGDKVPFMVQPLFFAAIVFSFLICAGIGGIASVRAVTKIDPVEAIG